jgi:hypothetical protein
MELLQVAVFLALGSFPVLAAPNTTFPNDNVPSAQNSGAGIGGQPGGKNGPATSAQGSSSEFQPDQFDDASGGCS